MNKNTAALLMFASLALTLISGGVLMATASSLATITFLLGACWHIYTCCQHRDSHYHRRMYDQKW